MVARGKKHVSMGQTRPLYQVMEARRPAPPRPPPQKFCDVLHSPTRYDKQQPNFAWWSNYMRGIFSGSTTTPDLAKMFVTQVLMHICLRQPAFCSSVYFVYSQSLNMYFRII